MFKWLQDFEYFFKEDERTGYLSIFGMNILLIILLFYLAFTGIPEKPNLTDMYHVIIGALITLLATIFFEYSRDLARRKDLLWPYLEVLDELNSVIISVAIDVKRVFPLSQDLIGEEHYKDLIDNQDNLNTENLVNLIDLFKGLTEEQIYNNFNSQNLTEFCRHINIPYETLGRLYPMFLTIADLYSKEFIGWTSKLYKNLQNIKRFCSYNINEAGEDARKTRYAKFISEFTDLLNSLLNLHTRIEAKLIRYENYGGLNR